MSLDSRPFHRVVQAIRSDLAKQTNQTELDGPALQKWFDVIRKHEDRRTISIELIALSGRLHTATAFYLQVLTLIVGGLGVDVAARRLAENTELTPEALAMLDKAKSKASTMTEGLSPTTGGVRIGSKRR